MTKLPPLTDGIQRFRDTYILCVGDVMLDHYVYGRVERVSPEAPIPILRVERETRTLGGAGNVVRNLHALGVHSCLISVLGDDAAGHDVTQLIDGGIAAHMLVEPGRLTTIKTRYIGVTQQMLRADRESITPLGPQTRADLLRLVERIVNDYQIVVVSDYAKGVLGDGIAAAIISAARKAGKPVVVDPKGTDYMSYRGATVLKPNRRELALATGMPVATEPEIVAAARQLIRSFEFDAVLVSLSQDGMMLVHAGGTVHPLPAATREVYDVSGAGDTAIAALAAALAAGMSLLEAARLANVAAGIVVGKIGTAVAHSIELGAALLQYDEAADGKVQPLGRALERIAHWRHRRLRIGFTNGCFDLLHPGHVTLLARARQACDRLVVGLNNDASVARLKGPARPVQSEAARSAVLAALSPVDLVVIFSGDTPTLLIEAIRPDVLVKGADYRIEEVVGADFVKSYGGEVVLAELLPGYSTTATIDKLNQN